MMYQLIGNDNQMQQGGKLGSWLGEEVLEYDDVERAYVARNPDVGYIHGPDPRTRPFQISQKTMTDLHRKSMDNAGPQVNLKHIHPPTYN